MTAKGADGEVRIYTKIDNSDVTKQLEEVGKSVDKALGPIGKKAGIFSRFKELFDIFSKLKKEGGLANVLSGGEEALKAGGFPKIAGFFAKLPALIGTITQALGIAAVAGALFIGSLIAIGGAIFSLTMLVGKLVQKLLKAYSGMSGFSGITRQLDVAVVNLKNAFYSALVPLMKLLIPYLIDAVKWLTEMVNKVGMFIAALTGASTYMVYVLDDTSGINYNLEGAANSMEDMEAAAKGALASFDKINVLNADGLMPGEGGTWQSVEIPADVAQAAADTLAMIESIKQFFEDIETQGWEGAFRTLFNLGSDEENGWTRLGRFFDTVRTFFDDVKNKGWETAFRNLLKIPEGEESPETLLGRFFDSVSLAFTNFKKNIEESGLGPAIAWELDPRNWFNAEEDSPLGTFIDGLWDALWTGFLDWDWSLLEDLYRQGIDSVFGEGTWDWLKEILHNWRDAFWDGIKEGLKTPIDLWNWIKEHVFDPIIDTIKTLFGIASPSTVMAEIGGDLINGLKQGIENAWANITTWFDTTILAPLKAWFTTAWEDIKIGAENSWTNIKTAWGSTATWFKDTVIDPVSEKFGEFKVNIGTIFTNLWTDVKNTWDTVDIWFQNNVTTPVKNKFNTFKADVKTVFQETLQGIKTVWQDIGGWFASTVINPIIRLLNSMIGALETALNWVIYGMNQLSFDIPDWLGGGVFGFNLSPVWLDRIPELAKGAVIPPNSEFLAILGDQKSGRNIETPENLLRQIVREEMRGMTSSEPVVLHNVLKLGNKVVFEAWNTENIRKGDSLIKKGAVL